MTPLQQAVVVHSAAEDAVHDLTNNVANATADRDDLYTTGISPTVDEAAAADRRVTRLTADLAAARERLAEASLALAQVRRITRKQFADMAGIAPNTLSGYVTRGQAPQPDGYDDLHGFPWWYQATADAWLTNRPGQGARPAHVRATPKT